MRSVSKKLAVALIAMLGVSCSGTVVADHASLATEPPSDGFEEAWVVSIMPLMHLSQQFSPPSLFSSNFTLSMVTEMGENITSTTIHFSLDENKTDFYMGQIITQIDEHTTETLQDVRIEADGNVTTSQTRAITTVTPIDENTTMLSIGGYALEDGMLTTFNMVGCVEARGETSVMELEGVIIQDGEELSMSMDGTFTTHETEELMEMDCELSMKIDDIEISYDMEYVMVIGEENIEMTMGFNMEMVGENETTTMTCASNMAITQMDEFTSEIVMDFCMKREFERHENGHSQGMTVSSFKQYQIMTVMPLNETSAEMKTAGMMLLRPGSDLIVAYQMVGTASFEGGVTVKLDGIVVVPERP